MALSLVCDKKAGGNPRLPPAQQYERKKVSLFLFAAYADEIGRAEAPSDMQFRHCIFYLKTSGKMLE